MYNTTFIRVLANKGIELHGLRNAFHEGGGVIAVTFYL